MGFWFQRVSLKYAKEPDKSRKLQQNFDNMLKKYKKLKELLKPDFIFDYRKPGSDLEVIMKLYMLPEFAKQRRAHHDSHCKECRNSLPV